MQAMIMNPTMPEQKHVHACSGHVPSAVLPLVVTLPLLPHLAALPLLLQPSASLSSASLSFTSSLPSILEYRPAPHHTISHTLSIQRS